MRVSKSPVSPRAFCGCLPLSGAIIPVIRLEEEAETGIDKTRSVILVLEYQKYQLGILLFRDPYMVQAEDMTWIDMPGHEETGTDTWTGKAFYKYRDHLFSLGDIEKLMDHLMIFHNA